MRHLIRHNALLLLVVFNCCDWRISILTVSKKNQSQQSIVLYKVMHDQSTSSPEED